MQWEVHALHRDKMQTQGPAEADGQAVTHHASVQDTPGQPAVRMGVAVFKKSFIKCNFSLGETTPVVALPFHQERTARPSEEKCATCKRSGWEEATDWALSEELGTGERQTEL